MKKLLILIFCLPTLIAIGQNDSVSRFHHYVAIQFSDLVKLCVRLSYENQFSKRHSLKIEVGYKPNVISYSNPEFDLVNESDGVNSYTHKNILASVGYNYFFLQSHTGGFQWFLSGNIGYRYSYSPLFVDTEGHDGSYYYHFYSAHNNRIEFRALMGQRILPRTKFYKSAGFFEWFVGIGLYSEYDKYTFYGEQSGSDPCPVANFSMIKHPIPPESGAYWYNNVRFSFGLKAGAAWHKNKYVSRHRKSGS